MKESTQSRRKALIEEYKRTPKVRGIYEIRNAANGYCLVAASRDVMARLNRHQMDLKTGADRNVKLQRDWNEFAPAQFSMTLLEALDQDDDADYNLDEDLQLLEAIWLEKYDPEKMY